MKKAHGHRWHHILGFGHDGGDRSRGVWCGVPGNLEVPTDDSCSEKDIDSQVMGLKEVGTRSLGSTQLHALRLLEITVS